MIELRPFRAWRPTPDKAHLVGSRSYVAYSEEQLREKLEGNPYSFLHVIRPEAPTPTAGRRARFEQVRWAFKRFCDEGVLVRDEVPSFYIYEQQVRGNLSRGLIAGVSVQAYRDGRIKVHEQTLTAREDLFAEYLDATGINAEPVLLATPEGVAWEALLDPISGQRPDHDFTTTDRVRHRLWAVQDDRFRRSLQKAFADIPALYIADGHHRLASSARLAASRQAGDVDPSAWCLAYIVPRSQLYIYNFDRAVTQWPHGDEASFLSALDRLGPSVPMSAPWSEPGLVAIRTQSGWRGLRLASAPAGSAPEARLDAARLSEQVLAPLLGIHDLRTDARVRFVPGTLGTTALDDLVRGGDAVVAFHLHPVHFDDLRTVADAGGTMPPKSTWIEPKLRSGLVVYGLEDV